AGFTLTVNGSNFINGSVVRWNGADRTTTFVSATQLTATIPASDIATAGTAAVTVFTPLPGGGASYPQSFFVLQPGQAFFLDGFNRPDNPNIGNGWTEKFPNAFSIQNNEIASIDTAPIDYHDTIVYRPLSEDRRDVEVGVEFRVLPGQSFPQVHARVQRNTITLSDTMEGYGFFVDGFEPAPGRAIISIQPPVTNQFECYMLAIPFPSALQASERYRLRFRLTGANPVVLTGIVERFDGARWQVFASGTITHDNTTQRDPNLFCAQGTMPPPIPGAGAVSFAKWTTNNEVLDNFFWMEP
ncbi:MAG: IPT/TIG domain-containing protein, partial [Gammaproteobacteria bacterium]|nr:IPT/TIG domain-containing protein [Gammaproteobacteria bacterium]